MDPSHPAVTHSRTTVTQRNLQSRSTVELPHSSITMPGKHVRIDERQNEYFSPKAEVVAVPSHHHSSSTGSSSSRHSGSHHSTSKHRSPSPRPVGIHRLLSVASPAVLQLDLRQSARIYLPSIPSVYQARPATEPPLQGVRPGRPRILGFQRFQPRLVGPTPVQGLLGALVDTPLAHLGRPRLPHRVALPCPAPSAQRCARRKTRCSSWRC